jgi:hypothetical protein
MSDFYAQIEAGVREWVRRLRDAGINTECSCGHEGYIQCQCFDLPTELDRIKSVLHSHGCWFYEIHFIRYSNGPDFTSWKETIEIRSPMFKADLIRTEQGGAGEGKP